MRTAIVGRTSLLLASLLMLSATAASGEDDAGPEIDPMEERWYLTAGAGVNVPSTFEVRINGELLPPPPGTTLAPDIVGPINGFAPNVSAGAGVGIDSGIMRFEIRGDYNRGTSSEDQSDYDLTTFVFEPKLDYRVIDPLELYAGFGIGGGFGSISTKVSDSDGTAGMVYTATAGTFLRLGDDLGLDLSYRYIGTAGFNSELYKIIDYRVHTFHLSLRWYFADF